MRSVGLLLPWFLAACTSSYTVRIDGDVLGSEPSTPREVKAGVYAGVEVQPMLAASRGTLRPVPDATVAIRLVHEQTWKMQSAITVLTTVRVDPATGHFHVDSVGRTSDGPVRGVQLEVTSPQRERALRQIPVTRDVPFETSALVVLDPLPGVIR